MREVVINTSWLAEQFPLALGDGSRWNLRLHYAHEGPTPLETGGGMLNALPLLGDAPFLVVNGDIWTDFDFSLLPREPAGEAHLLLVDNPPQHPRGDYHLDAHGVLLDDRAAPCLSYAGIGVYRPSILDGWRAVIGDAPGSERTPPRFSVVPLQKHFMAQGRIIVGPAGKPGSFNLPVRVSVTETSQVTQQESQIYSQFVRYPVSVTPDAPSSQFLFQKTDVTIPAGSAQNAKVYLSFETGPEAKAKRK